MLVTLIVVVVAVTASAVLAFIVDRRRKDAPTTPHFATPQQLDPADFGGTDRPWLLVLFSSETCSSCHAAREALELVRFDTVTVADLPAESCRAVHQRYGIDAVPIMVLADREGVVRWSWLGAPPREALRDILVDVGVITPDEGTPVDL